MTHVRNAAFTLLGALWGDAVLDDGSILSPCRPQECSPNEAHQTRKGRLIRWLIESIDADKVAGLNLGDGVEEDSCALILKYLLEGNVHTAVKTAVSSGQFEL